MDEIFKRISERVAEQSSRRGFFSTLGKAVLGAAALFIGQSPFDNAAQASLKCCNDTKACPSKTCPSGTKNTYTWTCGGHTQCHDCYDNKTHKHVCTYVLT
jgi:hypothetical protein